MSSDEHCGAAAEPVLARDDALFHLHRLRGTFVIAQQAPELLEFLVLEFDFPVKDHSASRPEAQERERLSGLSPYWFVLGAQLLRFGERPVTTELRVALDAVVCGIEARD